MADNKKYYYIKLKDNYFDQDNIRILESMENGFIYSLIILKLYLKASKYNGKLMMTQSLPYSPSNVDILANVLSHDIAHVKEAIRLGVELDLITILDGQEIWLNDIQNLIGKSTTEADRIRSYRKGLDISVQMYDKSTPKLKKEKDIEIEKELEIKKDIKKKREYFIIPSLEEITLYCSERKNSVDPEKFSDFYTSKGWFVGKNKMKDWKSAVRNWERNNKKTDSKIFGKGKETEYFNTIGKW